MKHFFDILKNKKLWVTLYLLLGIGLALLNTFSAKYFQKVLDDFGSHNLSFKTILIYAFVLLLICGFSYFDEYPGAKLSESIYLDFKLKAMKKVSTIDYNAYQALGTGNLIQRIESGANSGKAILFDFYFRLFRELIPSILFSLIFIAAIDPKIMLYIAVGYLLIFITTNLLLKYLYHIKSHILNNEEQFNSYLIRSLMELVIFRLHKKFPQELEKTTQAAEQIIASKTRMKLIHEAFFAIFAFFIIAIKVMILFISWKNQSLSVGALVALLALVDKAYSPIAILNVLFVQYKLDKSTFQRYTEFLDLPEDPHLTSGKLIPYLSGKIDFKQVDFSYPGKKLFEQLSLKIDAGHSVAFVGESGSGKSTIVKLLVGLIKPSAGSIMIDGFDLSSFNLNALYDHISYTSQESPIFNGTLRENIVFDKAIPDQAIIDVFNHVNLTAFYSSLPNGLDTAVGERGMTLSGGERQRIALARLYFSDAKIIILDEATSAMDNITEEQVVKNLMQFLKKKTIITVAHRLNTVKDVEQIYVFKSGKIVSTGRFDELLTHDSYFGELWRTAQT